MRNLGKFRRLGFCILSILFILSKNSGAVCA